MRSALQTLDQMYGERFLYTTLVASQNDVAWERMYEDFNSAVIPTVMFDGGFYGKYGSASNYLDYLELLDSACARPVDSLELTVSMAMPLPTLVQATISLRYLPPSACCQIMGDVKHDGSGPLIDDLVYLVTYMFQDGPLPPCMAETDVNGDGSAFPDIADLVYLVTYMFQDGPALAPCPEL